MAKYKGVGERSLVIGDAHLAPGQSLKHIEALNKLARREGFDRVIIIGDWVDMGSLSRFDTIGSKAMEGARIEADVHAGVQGIGVLLSGIRAPTVFIEGNHEERHKRMEEEHPKLTGLLSISSRLGDATPGHFTYIPYRDYFETPDKLGFTHIPHNNMKPIESTYGAQKVLQSMEGSVIYGHTHKLDFSSLRRNNGQPIYALNVGCFILPENDPAYMKGKIKNWWRGVVVINHAAKGKWRGEFETISLERVLSSR